jgi:type I restriction enzyme S subunit
VQRIEQNRPVKTKDILSLSLRQGVIPYSEKKTGGNKAKDDLSAYTLAYPGDIVLNSMNVVVGSVGLSKYFGAVSPVYYVLHVRDAADSIHYFDALFQDRTFQQSLWGLGNGILFLQSKTTGKFNTIRMRIPMHALRRVVVPHPPPDEQAAIVRFLDWANGRLERTIRAKRKVIALLNEQKQAIIHRAVTRGLDQFVPLKPSGVPWLGDIPQHWETIRSKWLFSPRKDLALPDDVQLSATQAYGVIPQAEFEEKVGRRVVKISMHLEKRRHVEKDDFVISMRSFQGGLERAWASGAIRSSYVVLSRRKTVDTDTDFFSYLFKSRGYIRALQATGDFIRDGQDLNFTNFCRVDLPLIPGFEQGSIAKFIANSTRGLDLSVSRLGHEIDLLREYRTRLVADVVTGKLDVREAAAQLPAEASLDTIEGDDADLNDETEIVDEAAA